MDNYLPLSSVTYNRIFRYYAKKQNKKDLTKNYTVYKGDGLELDSEKGYYHKFVSFNKFELKKTKINKKWIRAPASYSKVKKFICDKKCKLLSVNNEFVAKIREDNKNQNGDMADTYLIHDNGWRPFIVYCSDRFIRVYKQPDTHYKCREWYFETDDECNINYYIDFVCEYSMVDVKKLFIGEDVNREDFKGNTVLIVLNNGKCVSVGNSGIYQFDLDIDLDEEVLEYFSPVGNSDVPYSYAVSTKNVYFICEKCCVNVQFFQRLPTGSTDPYMYLYGHYGGDNNSVKHNRQPMCNLIQLFDTI